MKPLAIDPEFKSLIPPLADEEYSQLESNLKTEGCRDPLVTWEGIIVDGHNRFEICTRNGISFEKISKRFADRSEAVEWIIRNQFGRRNLSAYQRTMLALKLEAAISERAEHRMKSGKQLDPKQNSAQGQTRDELAKLAGVSHDTVDKVKKIERLGTPDLKAKLAKGEISINKASQEVAEQDSVVVDGTKESEATPKRSYIKVIESEGMRIWGHAKGHLDRINKHDEFRVKALEACIEYCNNRLKNRK